MRVRDQNEPYDRDDGKRHEQDVRTANDGNEKTNQNNEQRTTNYDELRRTNYELRITNHEKRKTKNEKRKTRNEKRETKNVKLLYFGTPDFAVPSLRALLGSRHEVIGVVAQPDRPSGRGMKLQKPPVAALALDAGVPLYQPAKLDALFLEQVRALAPDLGVVVAYGKILRKSLLEVPPHGFINVHGSLLPKYRGAAPIQRAVEAGELETGVTIMRIDEELDHGPMFAMSTLQIAPDERTPSLFHRLAAAGGELLVEVVDAIAEGRAVEQEQDHAAATYAKKIEKEEGRIRWSDSAGTLYNRFRAFDPWPGTFFEHHGEIIKVPEMKKGERSGRAGEIIDVSDRLVVGCGEGSLELILLQRPGKKAAAAVDVARGLGFRAGQLLQ